jgi:F0F1-type ATP synthase membrane subunit c/vacuolar-type H+-ATPase subunit K
VGDTLIEQSAKNDSIAVSPAAAGSEIAEPRARFKWIGWSSFFFAVVQSVCSAFVALSGLRILIGAAAFGAAIGVLKIADRLHFAAIRIPMMALALFGSLFNLLALWQVRRLRGRSASAWRQKSLSSKKINSERLQLALSILTLVLLAVEYYFHRKLGKD